MKKETQDRKKRVRIIAIVGTSIISALVAALAVHVAVCLMIEPKELELRVNKTLILDGNGELYAELQRFGRDDIPGLSDSTALRFAGNKLHCDISTVLFGSIGITDRSISELIALEYAEYTDIYSLCAYAAFIDTQFHSDAELARFYCGSAYFGNGIYGLDRAAVYYFGKTADNLGDREMAFLRSVAVSRRETASVPELMRREGTEELCFNSNYEYAMTEGSAYLTELCASVKESLINKGLSTRESAQMLYDGQLTVYSCLDAGIQGNVDSAVTNYKIDEYQAAAMIADVSGHILASSGGCGRLTLIDRAIQPHKIGSSIKPPGVYAPAVEQGIINYSTIIKDIPYDKTSGWPVNFDGSSDGKITAVYALRRSKNTVAVAIANKLGVSNCAEWLGKFGLADSSNDKHDLAGVSLGYSGSGHSLSELCGAYEVFANGGVFRKPVYFTIIKDDTGKTIANSDEDINPVRIVSPQTAYIINRMLKSNVDLPDGLGYAARIDGTEAFGKTGTVDNSHGVVSSKIFVGSIPGYVGAIWVGLDDFDSIFSPASYVSTVEIWRKIFTGVNSAAVFDAPDGITATEFCTETGKLASDNCPHKELGYYRSDKIPAKCDKH